MFLSLKYVRFFFQLLTKGNRPNDDDAVLEIDTDQDPFCTDIFTWDPRNPLNGIGPHSGT